MPHKGTKSSLEELKALRELKELKELKSGNIKYDVKGYLFE